LAEQIASITIDELGFDACGVLLLHKPLKLGTDRLNLHAIEPDNYLMWQARIGRFRNEKVGNILLKEKGLVPTAVRKGEIIYVPDVSKDSRYVPDNTYTQSEMVIPLRAYNKIIGAIDLQSPHINGFDERTRRIITVFAENAGLALETVRLYDQLREHAQELESQISQRHKTEQALRTSDLRYKQLVENATDIIYRTDANGFCTYANPVTIRTLGYSSEKELIGCHYTDFIHPEYKAILVQAYNQQQLEQTGNTYIEFIALDKHQKEIWLGQNVQLITEEGQVIGFQALARDITKRREMEAKLRSRSNELNATNAKLAKALRAKDEFLANMSHELRTPLNAILGKAEILLEGIHGQLTDKQEASVQIIGDSGNHLLELINDILDIAKIEAGKIELDIQKVSLATVCESSLQFVRQMAYKKQIRLLADIAHPLKTCQADERRLKQILINLLSNAVKFTPAGGEVGLNVLSDPDRDALQFQVWDTGIGISPENMKHLFKPFMQLDSSLVRLQEGTGLGLSLVYRLTEMHGGSVSLDSQLGVGSCFTVTLPQFPLPNLEQLQKQAENDLQQFATAGLNKYPPGREPLILLVEDNETNIETVLEYLPVWGYRLTVAHNGEMALQRAREEKPDLILMDIQIPEMDGLTAVRRLRREKEFKDTPIVTLTALAMHGDRDRCLEAGANEYLSKPIQLRQLVTLIGNLLNDKRQHLKEQGDE
jgi:PAS domain S-box-containing protein